ncbi:hypothetical protein HMSSN139_61710 [Paenibacillus sp. HMSSN-139]|nr:hypothetical protein HMSSN139_61710 [Paenibacillus sp. HMSSN-139]
MFSFNSPFGACPECDGLGVRMIIDKDLLISDPSKSIEEGAFEAWAGGTSNYYPQFLRSVCEHFHIPQNVPVSELTADQMDKLLYGTGETKVRFRYENDFGMSRDAYVTLRGSSPTWNGATGIPPRKAFASSSRSLWAPSLAVLVMETV